MGLGKVGNARRVFYSLRLGSGAPATGVAAIDQTVTVDNPGATATITPAAVEVGGGRYYFDITGAFSTTHGAGTYGGNVVVSSVAPRVVDVVPFEVDFFVNDVDDLATAVDLAAIQADTDDIQTRLPATLTGGRMRSHVEAFDAGVIDAAAIATDAIDADALAADAVAEIQGAILSDATPFPGANVDVAISTRSDFDESTDPVELLDAGGAAGTSAAELVVDIDAALTAAHGAGSWVGSTLTAGAVATAVWSESLPGAFGPGTAGLILGTNLDVVLSTRAAPGDAMTLTVGERTAVATEVDSVLTAAHGAGSWVGIASSLTPTQDDRLRLVWKVLGLDPLQPTTHATATIAVDGSITTPDAEVDITVDQIDANTASFTNA